MFSSMPSLTFAAYTVGSFLKHKYFKLQEVSGKKGVQQAWHDHFAWYAQEA